MEPDSGTFQTPGFVQGGVVVPLGAGRFFLRGRLEHWSDCWKTPTRRLVAGSVTIDSRGTLHKHKMRG